MKFGPLLAFIFLFVSLVDAIEKDGKVLKPPGAERFKLAVSFMTNSVPKNVEAPSKHDAYLDLTLFGSKKIVPYLIEDLKDAERSIEARGGLMICTWAHLIDVLQVQTGQNFGVSYKEWNEWWRSKGKLLPNDHFNPKKHRNSK
jgi:hypothetical protein